ncbi:MULTISPECIES: SHOCT domain-containing protein [Paenibacillus]|uniref:Putative oligomerization/nucleic acid binding protein n=1 Tax=Paenibacillus pabuli TaxID=1472 RepID=A0A855YAN7_9BACL|nr:MULTISPECIES: SHOCT domain-containing protein [Paenibacillus]PWW40752.1 putative oligomerization/nucleic acid binding protein [Paenibacillus pabuli]PXW11876.1 putative oligomerization/nucleic acid binding protein [Paenibacillus taichungensis]
MKVLSIIGIVLFTLTFLMIFGLVPEDSDSAAILGLLSMLYAIPFSIIALVVSSRRKKQPVNVHEQLLQLGELKDKNIISEYEFDQKKEKLLSKIK